MNVPSVKLNNNVEIPSIGLGTYSLNDIEIYRAITIGYRHLDTAKHYKNENDVGIAVKKSGIEREKFFITTKIMRADLYEGKAKESLDDSLLRLKMDYVDLYLIHFPPEGILERAWNDMEKLYESGKVRSIGVSNFSIEDLTTIKNSFSIKPVINQICSHPYKKNLDIINYCKELGIQSEAYSPLGGNSISGKILNDENLIKISVKYNLTVSQLILRWNYERGIISIPRSTNDEHLRQNLNIFNLELSKDDNEFISNIEERRGL